MKRNGNQSMVTKPEVRELIEVLGVFIMFAFTLFAYLAWFLAFVSGGRAWISVNVVGEMYVEYLLWIVVTAIVTLSFYYYLTDENGAVPAEADGPRRYG